MRTDFETVAVERHDDDILLVTLNRPDAANALNTQMGLDLMELFEGFSVDLEELRVVILTGQGTKAFCAGGVPVICFPISRSHQRHPVRRPQLSPFEANYVGYFQPSISGQASLDGVTHSPNAGQCAGLARN
jgi:hypothetical protein